MDRVKFHQLYQENQEYVRSVLYYLLVFDDDIQHLDDLVQEVFIKVWKSHDHFQGNSSFRTWIYRLSYNVFIDFKRKKKRRGLFKLFTFSRDDFNEEENHIESIVEDKDTLLAYENRDLVIKGIQKLKKEYREVIVFSVFQELAVNEIAEILTISDGTVKSRLHYARKELQKYFIENGVNL